MYQAHSNKLVLVKLNSAGLAYSHVGSINGSEAASKISREAAVQVESQIAGSSGCGKTTVARCINGSCIMNGAITRSWAWELPSW